MIGRRDLNERVREWGLREDVVVKDYVIGWALWGIGSHPSLSMSWAFKGGTCSIRSIAPRLTNLGNNNRYHQPVMGRQAVVIARPAVQLRRHRPERVLCHADLLYSSLLKLGNLRLMCRRGCIK